MPVNGNDKILSATRSQVAELEAQLSTYRGDLHAREERAELRASLKEAVRCLKPLQDAVGKARRKGCSASAARFYEQRQPC
jgi:DNA-binding transcriptional MerR regulator